MAVKTRANEFLSPSFGSLFIGGESELPTPCATSQNEGHQQAWQKLIEMMWFDWGLNPEQFDDEGTEPPSRETIGRAIKLAQQSQKLGGPPPDSIVPDANGGIVFEWREQDVAEVLHIWSDGTAEYQRFHGMRLVERRPL